MLRAYRCSLTPDDFLFFVSTEFNLKSKMVQFIHNYSLMYALRDEFHIGISGYKPRYEEDLYSLDFYCNPASPINNPSFTYQTYNSIDTLRNTPEEPQNRRRNVPSFGKYQKIIPMSTCFLFYMITKKSKDKFPRIIRVGKKLAPCRLKIKNLEVTRTVRNPINPVKFDTPLNLIDMSYNNKIEKSSIFYVFPSPIITQTVARIPYLQAKDGRRLINLPIPKHFLKELDNR